MDLSGSIPRQGRCFLLKSPDAGYGKTHLLSRARHQLGSSHEFIALQAVGGDQIDTISVLKDVLKRLVRSLPRAGGLTVMDLVTRRLFATSLQPLVNSGEVPCQDREDALNSLKLRPIETLDFHNPNAITAHWAQENFELLGPRLSLEMAQRNSLALREVSFWVNAFFQFASTSIGDPKRSDILNDEVFKDESLAHERLVGLLGLLTSIMRVVLVADELEGFYGNEKAGQKTAAFLTRLQQEAERVDLVIATNHDLWDSAFRPLLSSGLVERLEENQIDLKPLERWQVQALLESRLPGQGEKLIRKLDQEDFPTRAREVVRKARNVYDRQDGDEGGLPAAFADDVFGSEDNKSVGAAKGEEIEDLEAIIPETEEELPELKETESPFKAKSEEVAEPEETIGDAAPLPSSPLDMGEPETAFADFTDDKEDEEEEGFFGATREGESSFAAEAPKGPFGEFTADDGSENEEFVEEKLEGPVANEAFVAGNSAFPVPEPDGVAEGENDSDSVTAEDFQEFRDDSQGFPSPIEEFIEQDQEGNDEKDLGDENVNSVNLDPEIAAAPESIPVPLAPSPQMFSTPPSLIYPLN